MIYEFIDIWYIHSNVSKKNNLCVAHTQTHQPSPCSLYSTQPLSSFTLITIICKLKFIIFVFMLF